MQLALRDTTEVGARAGRILLGDRRLDVLGLVDRRPNDSDDLRLRKAGDLEGYTALVTDAVEDADDDIAAALDAGVSCVTWVDDPSLTERYGAEFSSIGKTLLCGANVASGIGPCLAMEEAARSDEVLELMVAWTEPGTRLRRGEPIAFPDPVGPLWGRHQPGERPYRTVVAPTGGIWSGAMVRVTTSTGDGIEVRLVGVADLGMHLEALALSAGALAIDSYGYGATRPEDRAEDYLAAALNAGLDVAAHTLDG